VPLAVQLLYENGDVPYQQEILTITPDSELATDKNGRARLRFRIEEVSKNHRGQKFRLLISADTKECPTLGNVAPVRSDPILVLSKRKPPPKVGSKKPKQEPVNAGGRGESVSGGVVGRVSSYGGENSPSCDGVSRRANGSGGHREERGESRGLRGGLCTLAYASAEASAAGTLSAR
ncbi:unnamed protein product, partial [Choristocarpus tenellus]